MDALYDGMKTDAEKSAKERKVLLTRILALYAAYYITPTSLLY